MRDETYERYKNQPPLDTLGCNSARWEPNPAPLSVSRARLPSSSKDEAKGFYDNLIADPPEHLLGTQMHSHSTVSNTVALRSATVAQIVVYNHNSSLDRCG
jgi:hypothetical protein